MTISVAGISHQVLLLEALQAAISNSEFKPTLQLFKGRLAL